MIFLDEPTTYLDMAHQLEILELLERLNIEQERTIVMVLHDLNQAARFADYIIAMKDGDIIQAGDPEAVISHDVLKKVFHIDAEIGRDPRTAKPICITYNLLKGKKRMYSKRSKTTTTKKLLIPFIALLLILSACSSKPAETNSNNTGTAESPKTEQSETPSGTITYESENGPVEVPATPQRVIVLSSYVGDLLALGVNMVGVDSWSKANPAFADKIKDAEEVTDESLRKSSSWTPTSSSACPLSRTWIS